MKTLSDYQDAFLAIQDFEQAMAKFTGAPYCVTTDCCTHAIEIAFRLFHNKTVPVTFPSRTYLSVLMTMHKVGVAYTLEDRIWKDYYVFEGSRIWDCARYLQKDMYVPGTVQCLSFGRTKPLEIGRGGCLLTDDLELYRRASRMRYDGRDIFQFSVAMTQSWDVQKEFDVGYHYYLRPEDCVQGLNLLEKETFVTQLDKFYNYPDCRNIVIRA